MLIALCAGPPDSVDAVRRGFSFRHLGSAATAYGLPLVVAQPSPCARPARVAGWLYQPQSDQFSYGRWPMPVANVYWDALYLADLRRLRIPLHQLRADCLRQRVALFNPPMPTKDQLFRTLELVDLEHGRIPLTRYRVSEAQVLALLHDLGRLWWKPVIGSGGRDMAFLRRLSNRRFAVVAERFYGREVQVEMDQVELLRFLAASRKRKEYMVQEHVPLMQDAQGRQVDFRVTVQRDDSGAWGVTAVTQRTAAQGSALTNFHAGGDVRSVTNPTAADRSALRDLGLSNYSLGNLRTIAVRAAAGLQVNLPALAELGQLGVDIGCTPSGARYVYDCNGRPGRDILTDSEVRASMRRIAGFSRWLLDGGQARAPL